VYYRERIIEGRSHVEEPWPAVQRYEAMIESRSCFTLGEENEVKTAGSENCLTAYLFGNILNELTGYT